jgi:hypothetical protein
MKNDITFVKCASPECRSAARYGNVCTYHSNSTYYASGPCGAT